MNGINFSLITILIKLSTTFNIATVVQSYQILHSISQQQIELTIKCHHNIPNGNSELKQYVFVKNRTVYGADTWLMRLKIMGFVERRASRLAMVDQNFTNVNLNLR